MRETWNLRHATTRLREAKQRARVRPSPPRFQLEQLETRVLLFATPIGAPVHLVDLGSLTPQTAVSFPVPTAPDYTQEATILPSIGQTGQIESTVFTPLHLALSSENGPPVLIMVDGGVHGATSELSPHAEQSSLFPVPGPFDSPYIARQQDSGGPVAADVGGFGFALAGYGRQVLLDTSTASFASGEIETGPGLPSAPAFDDVSGGLSVPPGVRESVEGALVLGRPGMGVQIPFDSSSESFALTLRALDDSAVPPVFNSLGMYDSEGNSLIQAGLSSAGGVPLQAFNLAFRGAPPGGHLVLNVSLSNSNSSTTESGPTTVSSASSNSSVPFVVTVQRLDAQEPSASSSEPAQAPLSAGTLTFPATAAVGVPPGAETQAQQVVSTDADVAQASSDPPATAVAAAAEAPSDSGDSFIFRVPTGPLASRNAGPLGPILASVGSDPTPEVDRLERAPVPGNRGPGSRSRHRPRR